MNDKVTNKQLYDSLNEFRKENREMFDSFKKEEFIPMKNKVDTLWTWGVVFMSIITFVMQMVIFWVQKNIFHS